MVLADAEDVEPDLVGELDLLDEMLQPLRGAAEAAVGLRRGFREGVDAELDQGTAGVRACCNFFRSRRCASISRRGTPFTIQSGAGRSRR